MDGILKLLWTSGNALESGGAVSASLAIMLVLLVKKVLAMVLLVVLFVAFLMMLLVRLLNTVLELEAIVVSRSRSGIVHMIQQIARKND